MSRSSIAAVLVGVLCASGCAQLTGGLGDGRVLSVVEVGTAASLLDKAYPGSGAALKALSAGAADITGKVDKGPFGGLPYKVRRDVILTDGTSIPEERIAQIVETLTPIVPEAIVRVVSPASFGTTLAPAVEAPAPVSVPPAVPAVPGAVVRDADVENAIGE